MPSWIICRSVWESRNREYSRPLPLLPDNMKDESGIIRNVTTWFLGHACKWLDWKIVTARCMKTQLTNIESKYPEYAEEDDDTLPTDIFGDTGKNEK